MDGWMDGVDIDIQIESFETKKIKDRNLVYESCDEWTKIIRNYGGGEGEDGQTIAPAICAVQCVRNEN